MSKKLNSSDLGSALGAEALDRIAKKAYCDALDKYGPMGGITCNNVFSKLETNPLFISPTGQNINLEYRMRCQGMINNTDLIHCKDNKNKTCN